MFQFTRKEGPGALNLRTISISPIRKLWGESFASSCFMPLRTRRKSRPLKKRRGIPILKVAVKPTVFEAYLVGDVPDEIFERLIEVETAKEEPDLKNPDVVYAGGEDSRLSYGVKPEFQSYLNDPSGFFKFRVGVKPWGILNLWKGGEAYARFDVPFYSFGKREGCSLAKRGRSGSSISKIQIPWFLLYLRTNRDSILNGRDLPFAVNWLHFTHSH